ncbi:MAG: BrnA antitoxin family protein [Burkholderiaceae bacterium]|nr:BrnA antitoxin family protein [Burkholderiaceae bacterium]
MAVELQLSRPRSSLDESQVSAVPESARRRSPSTSIAINIRLSPEVLEAFKATGDGWQTKVDSALKDWLKDHSPA